MAEVSRDNETVEKGPEGTSPESVPVDATVSRVKLLDTIVDTFLQKLVAARSYERFTSCYKHFYQLNPEVTRQVYDKFVAQLQTSIREEISEIKQEGNLEAVLNSLDEIVEEGKAHGEPAWRPSGIPEMDLCSVMAPYLLKQQDTLCRRVRKQEAKNQELADAVVVGRRRVEELEQQVQVLQQAWQALHREQRELLSVLRAPE
ncbi:polyamine-modulated factor 1 isoform X1 [Meriones unguiculatus]|uniref:polyamine-modulated factor 1 isoform X1 n=1 Tax=Meriones unguiculatus TaxID=10047 RepID=UPI000B4EAD01|nr:polyamine-modulated factor 1 isoform X1 [Meriones unguiculatus]